MSRSKTELHIFFSFFFSPRELGGLIISKIYIKCGLIYICKLGFETNLRLIDKKFKCILVFLKFNLFIYKLL